MRKYICYLDDIFKIFLPDRYTNIIEKSDIKLMNENNTHITYKGLENISVMIRTYIKLGIHNFHSYFIFPHMVYIVYKIFS